MLKKLLFICLFLGEIMAASMDKIKIDDIEIPVIYEKSTLLPVVNLQIVFEGSGSIEDDKLPGLAYFSSKILNEGTKKDGAIEFAKKLENRAIHLNVSSGLETMVIELSSLKSEFNEALRLLGELLKDPNLTQEAFKKVKTDIEGLILSKQNDFDYIAQINLISNLFEKTPLQYPNIGTLESIKQILLKDVKNFIQKHICLNRMIIVVGGDIEIDEIKDGIKKVVALLPKGEKAQKRYFMPKDDEKFVTTIKDTKQAYIYFGAPFNIKPTDADAYKSKVAIFILGAGGFGSRMMEEIRVKRGLAYSAYARANINKTNSYLSGYLQTKLENQDEAIKIVKEVISEFVKNGVTQKELDSAKKFLLGSEPLRNELLSQRLNSAFNEYYKGLPFGHSKEELKKIEALELEELNKYIASHNEITKLTFSVVTNR